MGMFEHVHNMPIVLVVFVDGQMSASGA